MPAYCRDLGSYTTQLVVCITENPRVQRWACKKGLDSREERERRDGAYIVCLSCARSCSPPIVILFLPFVALAM